MSKLPIPFGYYTDYPKHTGVDFPQSRGTPFRASGPGRVSSIDYGERPGHTVWVQYDNGPNVGYCHMDRRTKDVVLGQRVVEGTILGRVGSLGKFSTGPHLHLEIAGHATAAGVWRFFDKTRVVGQGSPAGGGETPFPVPEIKLEYDMIRIQSTNRGIALIGPGYYRPLGNNDEVVASESLITKHISGTDAEFDRYVSLALSGQSPSDNIIRSEGRPLKLYELNKKLIVVGPGGKVWEVPNDGYRVLLDALALAPAHPIRVINDSELGFIQQTLSAIAPDPRNDAVVDAVFALDPADVDKIADRTVDIFHERTAPARA